MGVLYIQYKLGMTVENRARLRWLASAVAVLPVVGSSVGSAPTSHWLLFIWRMQVVQPPSVSCIHRLDLVQMIDSNLRPVYVLYLNRAL
jgi:hypothetical protein